MSYEELLMPRISVVIPVYNVEQYLRQCLDSVLGQTLRDIEVICVNDGSPDGSPAILREYAMQDERVIVINKENGGYGQAVNTGLSRATGEYIAVVEPDDFISASMYETLLGNAMLSDGRMADVVKSAYWEFYDEEGNPDGRIVAPHLMNKMVKRRRVFTVEEYPEVLYHHPSIWSAIYRRDFLREQDIRFVEAKGGGWADNPFFFETLCTAQEIVWVPEAFYYYRKTNYEASSYLRDYTIPFDRCREIHQYLKDHEITSRTILSRLYHREFSYVFSILERFEFFEDDPKLLALILETFERMDEEIVLTDKVIRRERKDYYLEMTGKRAERIKSRAAVPDSRVSIIVPIKNNRMHIWNCLASVTKQSFEDVEVICVDCGSRDRSWFAAMDFAARDQRFVLMEHAASGLLEGLEKGLDRARGEYVQVLFPQYTLQGNGLAHAYGEAIAHNLDVCVFEPRYSFESALSPFVSDDHAYGPFASQDLASHLFNVLPDCASSKLFRRSYLSKVRLCFDGPDTCAGAMFTFGALMAAKRVLLRSSTLVRAQDIMIQEPMPRTADEPPRFDHLRTLTLEPLRNGLSQTDDFAAFDRSFTNYALHVMMGDLASLLDPNSFRVFLQALTEQHFAAMGIARHGALYFHDQVVYDSYLCLQRGDLEGYFLKRIAVARRNQAGFRKELRKVRHSTSYKVSRKMSSTIRKYVPLRVIAWFRRRV